jgi:fused signal recognition particle receptor
VSGLIFLERKGDRLLGLNNKDKKKNLFSRLRQGLAKTRSNLIGRLDQLILGKKEIDEDLLEEIEEILFTSDLGVAASQELIDLVEEGVARKELDNPEKLKTTLKENIIRFLDVGKAELSSPDRGEPYVIMVIGVNGVGKTTTIGKVANLYRKQGKKVIMVAADTFRAAATEQLMAWGERVGAEVIKQKHGADPSAVVFDAIDAAMSRGVDVVLIDTAGRLHTKANLMDELEKMYRVIKGKFSGGPHEVWLVLDATTGQNAIAQAEMFHKRFGITGIVLTKLDGTAKGGIVVGITRQLGIPVKFIGIGEKMDDLRPFDAVDFVEAIFGGPCDRISLTK